MASLEKLQKDAAALPAEDLAKFAKWVEALCKRTGIEKARAAPRKKSLAARALAEWQAAKSKGA
jgi:hypothetical protein